ncbi:hypothetical protein MLD38_039872 [Melastoma candidum]|uniref:Uncharacterized protein n=1 Tax=Melastoma candidum TaxID=119954 RepID=A0ACB9L484_9MYRT|nr:hypothetical protein MLD38_039872 [Melastoma candidum]
MSLCDGRCATRHPSYTCLFHTLKLIGGTNFTITYWNWDNPHGMVMPLIFTSSKYSFLYDQYKNAKHVSPNIVDLDCDGTGPIAHNNTTSTDNKEEKPDLTIMYRQMVSNAKKPIFFGQQHRKGNKLEPGVGSIETTPYNNIHH